LLQGWAVEYLPAAVAAHPDIVKALRQARDYEGVHDRLGVIAFLEREWPQTGMREEAA
jgi:hypothetical protein